MKWILIVVVALVVIAALIYLLGSLLPVKHQSMIESDLSTDPDKLWKILTTPADYKNWRSGIKELEVTDERHWSELNTHGDKVNYRADWIEVNSKLTTHILNTNLPYGGHWEFSITKTNGGSHLRITENGEVYNPIFRFMSKYAFGHDATLRTYMADLQKKLTTSNTH